MSDNFGSLNNYHPRKPASYAGTLGLGFITGDATLPMTSWTGHNGSSRVGLDCCATHTGKRGDDRGGADPDARMLGGGIIMGRSTSRNAGCSRPADSGVLARAKKIGSAVVRQGTFCRCRHGRRTGSTSTSVTVLTALAGRSFAIDIDRNTRYRVRSHETCRTIMTPVRTTMRADQVKCQPGSNFSNTGRESCSIRRVDGRYQPGDSGAKIAICGRW